MELTYEAARGLSSFRIDKALVESYALWLRGALSQVIGRVIENERDEAKIGKPSPTVWSRILEPEL
jgi:hypothetical protein